MFSNTLSFLSYRNVSDQVSDPYKTTGKIIVLYIYNRNSNFKKLKKIINMAIILRIIPGADKSLTRPGKKQAAPVKIVMGRGKD
jgi:hypothetical protein